MPQPQTEQHIKLLHGTPEKGYKVVGYERKELGEYFIKTMQKCVYDKSNTGWRDARNVRTTYNAFALRTPFKDKNDEWLWEGDRIRSYYFPHYFPEACYDGVIVYNNGCFEVQWDDGDENIPLYAEILDEDTTIERIGSIYEEE